MWILKLRIKHNCTIGDRCEKYEVISEKCPNCGKTKKEIQKRLKEGPKLSHEEIIRRAKEAGLPLKIKG